MVSLSTTLLSAYIKFGCISIREVYWKMIEELGKKWINCSISLERILLLYSILLSISFKRKKFYRKI